MVTGKPQETLGGLLNASFGTLVRPVVGWLDDSVGRIPPGWMTSKIIELEFILNELDEWKKVPRVGCFTGMKSENTQLCGDDFINHERRIPIKEPGFNRKYECFFFRGSNRMMLMCF